MAGRWTCATTATARFTVHRDGAREAEITLAVMGEMNVRNALGVFALCRRLGLPASDIPPARSFRGAAARK